MRANIQVNGTQYSTEVEQGELLLDLLRKLGFTSVREGCGVGACGSCTVLIDGVSVSSCLVLATRSVGKEIRTSDGLAIDDRVVRAFVEAGAAQCGYCIPGFVLMVTELLSENPIPDEEAIANHLEGNFCRCGTYPEILKSVLALSNVNVK